MKRALAPVLPLVVVGLSSLPGSAAPSDPAGRPPAGFTIVVGDRPLVGPFTTPESRGDRLFLPVVAIARALGDSITINAPAQRVEVKRQTGAGADFDVRMNQVRENGAPILVVQSAPILFSPVAEQLLLPTEIVTALLDVAVVVDRGAKRVRITRGESETVPVSYSGRRFFADLHEAKYVLNGYVTPGVFAWNATPALTGRLFDGRVELTGNFGGSTAMSPFQLRQGAFLFDRRGGPRIAAIDVGTGADLQFMSTRIRGGMLQQPVGTNRRINLFAGAGVSGLGAGLEFDTFIGGWYATIGDDAGKGRHFPVRASGGTLFFRGVGRTGALVTTAATHASTRNLAHLDIGVGGFKGPTLDRGDVNGAGVLLDVSDALQPVPSLTLQGRVAYVSPQVMMPDVSSGIRPMILGAGSVSWQPRSWLAAAAAFQSVDMPDPTPATDRNLNLRVAFSPRQPWPTAALGHTQGFGGTFGTRAFTVLNIVEIWRRWRFSFDALRMEYDGYPTLYSGTAGASVDLGSSSTHRLAVAQNLSNSSISGSLDWMGSSMIRGRLDLGLGAGYLVAGGSPSFFGRLVAAVRLPWKQELQVQAQYQPGSFMIYLDLRGTVYRSRRLGPGEASELEVARRQSGVVGRVYQDVDGNGRFDAGVDQPQPEVQVQVDSSYFAITDREGKFRIESLPPGRHQLSLNLLTVRADLTILDVAERQVTLPAGRDAIVQFRLLRSGRLSGTVWLDANGNGKQDAGEEPLADVRVLTGSNRDTLTYADGTFSIGDLPPGEHTVLVDEKTLPEGTRSSLPSRRAVIRPGAETRRVDFPIHKPPEQIEIKEFSP